MNALLAVESKRPGGPAGALEASQVLEGGVGAIQRPEPVRPRGRDDAVHDGMPSVAWVGGIVLVIDADADERHPHRGGVVTGPEDEGLEARRARGNLAEPEEPARRLDLRLDPYLTADPHSRFVLAPGGGGGPDIGGGSRLR